MPLFVALYFFAGMAQLTAYRVLMVWVYDRTESLLVATFMHGSLTASTIFVFTHATTGASFLIYIDLHIGIGRRDVDRRGSGRIGQQRTAFRATASEGNGVKEAVRREDVARRMT